MVVSAASVLAEKVSFSLRAVMNKEGINDPGDHQLSVDQKRNQRQYKDKRRIKKLFPHLLLNVFHAVQVLSGIMQAFRQTADCSPA